MNMVQVLALLLPTLFGTGIITWFVRGKIEEAQQIRERLRAEQRERYAQILNPYIQLFANPQRTQEATKVIQSPEYRKEIFDFALVADDAVLRAYIEMMKIFETVASGTAPDESAKLEGLRSFGRVLIELRRSVGNTKTKLSEVDVLRVVGVKDIDNYLESTIQGNRRELLSQRASVSR